MSPVLHVAVHSKLGRAETACALQAALALSLPLKQHEARLKHLSFWGKITARNGKARPGLRHCVRQAALNVLSACPPCEV
jgi:hypothetical protein